MRILPFLAGLLCLLSICVEAAPPELADLTAALMWKTDNNSAIEKQEADSLAALRKWYTTALEAVKKDAMSKGDLDTVLAADSESKRMDRDLTPEEARTLTKLPKAARDQYDKARAQVAVKSQVLRDTARREYTSVLEALEKKLTQQGKVDDAMAVRRERVETLAAATARGPGANSPAGADGATPLAAGTAPSGMPSVPGQSPEIFAHVPTKAGATPAPVKPAATPFGTLGGAIKSSKITIENPAKLEVARATSFKLEQGTSKEPAVYGIIPPELVGATMFRVPNPGPSPALGVAEFKALTAGRVYVGCRYGNEGGGGEWTRERWTEKDFVENGWRRVDVPFKKEETGTPILLFTKELKAGETGRLRCNKYGAPLLITFAE